MVEIANVIVLDRTVEIYVPSQCMCGKQIPHDFRNKIFSDVRSLFYDWFDGYAVNHIEGGWKLPDGKLAEEPVDVVCSKTNTERLTEREEDLKQLTVTVADRLTQDRVALTIDGRMMLYARSNPEDKKCVHTELKKIESINIENLSKVIHPPRMPDDRYKMQAVYSILSRFSNLSDARDLFCGTLNYCLLPGHLPCPNWPAGMTRLLVEVPSIIADKNGFRIVYIRLNSDHLLRGWERAVIRRIHLDDPSIRGIFIVSDSNQKQWEFVNAKVAEGKLGSLSLRRIRVGTGEKVRTATERLILTEIRDDEESIPSSEIQKKHDSAFDVEKVTEEFFQDYVEVFNRLKKYLYTGAKHKDLEWAHDYALQFLNRIMFLHFVQKKRWLGGDPDFLSNYWGSYQSSGGSKKTFCSKWLEVLFFEAFNNKFVAGRSDRKFLAGKQRSILAAAPYLNGGLFTENENDEKRCKYDVEISDELFEEILSFFGKYNFTISEDTPLDTEVAVDPEMIGKVYESLVNVSEEIDERGEAGIFYTPRVEIALMCRLALVNYLANHLPTVDINILYNFVFALEEEDKAESNSEVTKADLWDKLEELIRNVTACDPAVGSGSFLVGMLELLTDLTRRINAALKKEENNFAIKKRIINHSLYGVDVMKWAVEVCELRLWLHLVVDADLDTAQLKFKPLLPNLTFKVRPGDSLVQELGGIDLRRLMRTDLHGGVPVSLSIKKRIQELKKRKESFYEQTKEGRDADLKLLKHEEYRVFNDLLEERCVLLDKEINKFEQLAEDSKRQGKLLIGGGDRSRRQELEELNIEREKAVRISQREEIKQALEVLRKYKSIRFVWELSFIEIFSEKEGFDIVVGNPPYVRQENIADPEIPREKINVKNKKLYKEKLIQSVYEAFPRFFQYNHQTGSVQRKLDAKSDLYIYFYFHSLSLLNSKGSFCFITSNSWLDVGYGKDLQEFLLKNCHIKIILDNQVKRSFKQADVNTVIVLFSSPEEFHEGGLDKNARLVLFKVPFEQILSPVIFEEIEAESKHKTTPEYRVRPINQRILLKEGWEWPEDTTDEAKRRFGFSLKGSKYSGNKWGGKYLRAPDIYWTILEKGKDKLVRIDEIAEVKFGIKTGADSFFYLSKSDATGLGIEKEFIHPILVSSGQVKGYTTKKEDTNIVLITTTKSKKEIRGTGVLKYIERGESEPFSGRGGPSVPAKRPSCKSHNPFWYSIAVPEVPAIYWMEMRRERYFTLLNDAKLSADHTFYAVYPRKGFDSISFCGLLNCTLIPMLVEIFANDPGGGGTSLQTPIGEIKRFVLVPKILIGSNEIKQAFNLICRRECLSILKEVSFNDRRNLDEIVFDILGLTKGERDAVYEAVINLVEARVKKAESV